MWDPSCYNYIYLLPTYVDYYGLRPINCICIFSFMSCVEFTLALLVSLNFQLTVAYHTDKDNVEGELTLDWRILCVVVFLGVGAYEILSLLVVVYYILIYWIKLSFICFYGYMILHELFKMLWYCMSCSFSNL